MRAARVRVAQIALVATRAAHYVPDTSPTHGASGWQQGRQDYA